MVNFFDNSNTTPVERGLECLATNALKELDEIRGDGDEKLSIFPLTIFYAKREGDSINLSVRVRTSEKIVFYKGPYLPAYRAISFAHKLQNLFMANHYGINLTKEMIDE